MRFFSLLVALFLFSPSAFSGVAELLSGGSYAISGGERCPDVNKERARAALKNTSCPFREPQVAPTSPYQANAANALAQFTAAHDPAENEYFAKLAEFYGKESACATSKARFYANSPYFLNELEKKIRLLQQLTKEFQQNIQNAKTSRIVPMVCPVNAELVTSCEPKICSAAYKQNCKRRIQLHAAIKALKASIPFSHMPVMKSLLKEYSNPSATVDSALLKTRLSTALRVDALEVDQQTANLLDTARKTNGAGLNREMRMALFADPLIVNKMITRSKSADVRALTCRVNAHYGEGAEEFEKYLTAASIGVSLSGGLVAKLGSAGAKLASGAGAARALGLITESSALILETAATAIETTHFGMSAGKSCFPGTTAAILPAANQCSGTPDTRQMESDNCFLDMTLAGLNVVGPKFFNGEKAVEAAEKAELAAARAAAAAKPKPPRNILQEVTNGKR